MNDHQLGLRLRHQILTDLQRGTAADGRRLNAVVGDLCGDQHLPLLPALRHLMMSAAFHSAVGQESPLPPDPRLQLRLQQELEPIFASPICQRMGAVLRGLLDLPEAAVASVTPASDVEPLFSTPSAATRQTTPKPATPAPRPGRCRRLADGLTVGRALAGLPLIVALSAGWQALAWWLLLLAGLSDAADGWLARRAGGGSVWGARLDPLTDKILIAAPLLWLAARGTLPLWAIWLLLARELFISGWRAGQGSGGPASWAGKLKTILQFAALLLLLWPNAWGAALGGPGSFGLPGVLQLVGWWLFWPALLLALSSAWGYLRKG